MSDITNRHLEAAILDQKVAGAFAGKTYAFVAVKDETGYNPISGKTFHTHDEAKQWADGLNEHIGLSKAEALNIVGSTMFGGGRLAS